MRGELRRRIERQLVEIFHRADASLIGNQPLSVCCRVPIAHEVEPPRRDARAIAVLLERVHDKAVAVAGHGPGQRAAVALLNDHVRHAGKHFGVDEAVGAAGVG